MARREPAAVRSRIQSPSLISQVTSEPASGLACMTEAAIARVSRKSTLRRRSLLQTRHARLAIGMAFHSISGMFIAITNGLALNAIASDRVGRPSGDREENRPGTSPLAGPAIVDFAADFGGGAGGSAGGFAGAPGFAPATSTPNSLADTAFRRERMPWSSGSRARSNSTTRLAQAELKRAPVTPGCARSQASADSASAALLHSSGTCRRTRPGR